MDRIKNEVNRGTTQTGRHGEKARETRLRWFERVHRGDSEYVDRRMLEMELPGRGRRGRPKRRYMDAVREDMQVVEIRVEYIENKLKWKAVICCGNP